MRITAVRVRPDNDVTASFAAEATVLYDDGEEDVIWVSGLSQAVAQSAQESANPWLVFLLPLAVTLGENISTVLPADRELLSNLNSLQKLWNAWLPELSLVNISCPTRSDFAQSPEKAVRTASLFSGGVDSFHVIAEHYGSERIGTIDALITVAGFDIPLKKTGELAKFRASADSVARAIGTDLLAVATNLRETRFREANWGRVSHGCALAGVALLFQDELTEVLIGATRTFPDLRRWGSHPLTDPLCSTSAMRVTHFGATANRVEKTTALSQLPIALEHLRVCWRSGNAGNCGACEKCIRTMATLRLLGVLDECATFNGAEFSLKQVEELTLESIGDLAFFREIRDFAEQRGDSSMCVAAEKAIVRSERYLSEKAAPYGLRKRLRSWARSKPLIWRLAER